MSACYFERLCILEFMALCKVIITTIISITILNSSLYTYGWSASQPANICCDVARRHWFSRWDSVDILSTSWHTGISSFETTILDCPLPAWLYVTWFSTTGSLDSQNMWVVAEILFSSQLGAKILRGGNHPPRHYVNSGGVIFLQKFPRNLQRYRCR